jgi:hypothetical protein
LAVILKLHWVFSVTADELCAEVSDKTTATSASYTSVATYCNIFLLQLSGNYRLFWAAFYFTGETMTRLLRVAAVLLCAVGLSASASTMTATLTDTDGTAWANATYTAVLTLQGQPGAVPTISGVPVSPLTISSTASSSGVITGTFTDTSTLDQKNGLWVFTITPNASGAPVVVSVAITGSTPNLTNNFSSLKAPRFPAGLSAYGYTDGEVTNVALGDSYFNVVTPCPKTFTQAGWQCGGGGSSAPTLVAGSQILFLPYLQGSGTVLTDQSPNHNDCTFAAALQAPTWNNTGTGLLFNGNQRCTMPAGAMTGAKTIELWVALTEPMLREGAQAVNMLVSDFANNYIGTHGSTNGGIAMGNGIGTAQTVGIDRYIGNSHFAGTYSGTVAIHYINGRQTQGYIQNANNWQWTNTGVAAIGDAASAPANGWGSQFVLWGMAVYNTVLTPAQIQQNDAAMKATLATKGVYFQDFVPENAALFVGDSLCENLGGNFAQLTSPSYLAAQSAGVTQYSSTCLSSQTQVTINSLIATREYPILDGAAGGYKIVIDNAGTNDIRALSLTGAAAFANLQTYITTLRGRYPLIPIVVGTLAPRGDNSAAQEVQREAFNTLLIGAWTGGTLGVGVSVNDVANNPIVATLASPNNYAPTTLATCNNTVYFISDCIHWRPATTATMGTQYGAAILDAQGKLNKTHWINLTVPFQVLATFANTSQTLPIVQLGPTWQVCGTKMTVSTPFVGTSISALAVTLGDSTGTATQYLASQDMLTATSTRSPSSSFVSNHGIVQAAFSATGANFSALTAGSLSVDVCVIAAP